MAITIFGIQLGADKKTEMTAVQDTIKDGATELVDYGGVFFNGYDDVLNNIKDEQELIMVYRCLANVPEVDKAIMEIVNDSIVYPKSEVFPVKINMDNVELTDNIKEKIYEEFDNILELLHFDTKADDIFRDWYIDGRLPVFIDVKKGKENKGINKLIIIDPLRIKKVREIVKKTDDDGIEKIVNILEYYIYNPNANSPFEFANMNIQTYGSGTGANTGIKLSADSVIYSTSGLMDFNRKFIISYLHKAIKTANQLEQLEDSMVIYRMSRAPERRVFYVDVGSMPKNKAESYLVSLMNKFRNKISYDSSTGKIKNQAHQKSIVEDIWLPRREGGKGTEINTLGSGEGFSGINDETAYFKEKLYSSLNVPTGRLDNEGSFFMGREGEITREEVKFSKFINNLRNQFAKSLFDQALGTQLILKKVMTKAEFDEISDNLLYMWEDDSHFSELKEMDVISKRMEVLDSINDHINTYYSQEWVRKHILFQNEEEIEELSKQREKEAKEGPTNQDTAKEDE